MNTKGPWGGRGAGVGIICQVIHSERGGGGPPSPLAPACLSAGPSCASTLRPSCRPCTSSWLVKSRGRRGMACLWPLVKSRGGSRGFTGCVCDELGWCEAGVGMGLSPYAGVGMGPSPYAGVGIGPSPYAGVGMGLSTYAGVGMGPSPYAGVGMGLSPYAGVGMGPSPYAGVGMGLSPYAGVGMGLSPYAGVGMGLSPYGGEVFLGLQH